METMLKIAIRCAAPQIEISDTNPSRHTVTPLATENILNRMDWDPRDVDRFNQDRRKLNELSNIYSVLPHGF